MNNDIENPYANIPQPGSDKPSNNNGKTGIVNKFQSGMQSWKQNSEFRMKICNTCPHYAAPRCKLCGCFMIAKTKIPQASCPAGKW